MSLNEILGSAISGLAASQAGLRSVSNNVANVGTPGYARERVGLSAGVTNGRVSGVVVGEPERVADRFLENAVYLRSGDMGRAEAASSYLDRLQALLGAPDSEAGLPARLDAISSSAIKLTSSQSAAQNVAVFAGDVQDAIGSMKQLERDVDGLRADVESEVGYTVERINGLLSRIHDLNNTVAQLDGLGRSSAGAVDLRVSALEELSTLIQVTVRDQPDGRVTIDAASGVALLDKRLRQINYPSPGTGVAQPIYPAMDVRFADSAGQMGPATGDRLDSAATGGKLGGLIDLRDRSLPRFSEKLGVLFGGLAETLNAASNAGTTSPAPASLTGRSTGLVGTDRLGFTGTAHFAVVGASGTLVAKTAIDFASLGPAATVDDAVTAINAGLGGAATASYSGGVLTIQANGAGNGVAIAQDANAPSDRGGVGFSHYFGLNDVVRSDDSTLVPSGLASGDPHGFAAGQTAEIVLRDASGRSLTKFTLSPPAGGTFGDVVNQLNAGPLGGFGAFALDSRGRVQFQPSASVPGAVLSIASDSTERFGTGRSFSALSGLTGASAGLSRGEVKADVLADPSKMPLARLDLNAAVGQRAIAPGDLRGATDLIDRLGAAIDLGKDGVATLERFSTNLLGGAGLEASRAEASRFDAEARRNDAATRRDSFSGVNIDEELAHMVVLQNSYSAAARVMSTATEMYDTLIAMVG